jgi:glycosyltransferase involved in cell wall biosynthesis
MKVLFVNNYPMDQAWELWKKGEYPGHHLWGVTHLKRYGIDVEILAHEKYIILNKIGEKLRLGYGLDQQLRILFGQMDFDIIYSGSMHSTFLLSYLRCLGILKKPIVSVNFYDLPKTMMYKILVKGQEKILCISNSTKIDIEEKFNYHEKIELLEWGIDLSFYDTRKEGISVRKESMFVMAAGKTDRDYSALAKAFSGINYPLRIYCTEQSAPRAAELTPNVRISYNHPTQVDGNLSFRALVSEYEKSYAVGIPLAMPKRAMDVTHPVGLTSLLEAMAMGKAVVMTRNRKLNIDIEKERIGIWVEPGDVQGWQQAFAYLLTHPNETMEMGRRGYHLCQTKYNLDLFASNLAKIFHRIGIGKRST